MNFETFNLHPDVMAGVRALGYTTPTPIQSQAIPLVMQGRDIIGLAQTGTGKTAAFVLPILHRLMDCQRGKLNVLIMAPTRELAEQIDSAVTELGRNTGLRNAAIYGGVGMDQQVQKLRNGIEIVTACPGRLLDHLWGGSCDLSALQILVIDEADRMLDMGFLPDIKNILKCILQKRQTLLFSATMPANIRRLTGEILNNPVTVQVDDIKPALTVTHTLYSLAENMKSQKLKDILRQTKTDSVLVFTRTKFRAQRVAMQLNQEGYRTACLQGNLDQRQRQAAMEGFSNGNFKVLVATDIAARGIDVLTISHVINYDMPASTDDYIHRIGRTGRIGKTGEAFTFVTEKDALMEKALRVIFKDTGGPRDIKDASFNQSPPAKAVHSQKTSSFPRRKFFPRPNRSPQSSPI